MRSLVRVQSSRQYNKTLYGGMEDTLELESSAEMRESSSLSTGTFETSRNDEMEDISDLSSDAVKACGFESHFRYNN